VTLNRRDFVKGVAAVPMLSASSISIEWSRELVNDVHTGLNPTWVDRVVRPTSIIEIQNVIHECHRQNKVLSVSGSRHAAGGQQFAEGSTLLDMRSFNRVVGLDTATGILQVEGGVEWPELLRGYLALQTQQPLWGIRQKQGGADRMTLAGALSANAHGHCLGSPPIIADVEWIEIVTAEGKIERCDRKKNRELFALAIGGYGLFGIITTVGLRLARRNKLRRRVEKRTLAELLPLIEKRAKSGAPYGYFQYSIDETSDEFMRTGVVTTYEPVAAVTAIDSGTKDIDPELLAALLELAHLDRGAAYRKYATLELARDGEIEWSDLHQLSSYPAGYHKKIENHRGPELAGADLILEVYVPRQQLISFIEDARYQLLTSGMPLVYGTIRFIERDKESFLAWAKQSYACIIFTPHVAGGNSEMQRARDICRHLEHAATKRGGSFYLTYNRFAARSELDAAYPQFSDFLMLKKKYDPSEIFQSEWYRYYQQLYK
jgi:FAD/FMN-containing dehydrogenase